MLASEWHGAPAVGSRRLHKPPPVRVICVTSGKGGVGKTNITVNLGLALAHRHKRVMLLDADLGLANIDVILGLQHSGDLSHVIDGERTLEDIILTGPAGIKIIPASSGVQHMAGLTTAEHAGIIGAFSALQERLDVLLVDSAAGISDSVITFSRASQAVIVVVCDEPASLADAYALIKLLNRDCGLQHFHVLANRVTQLRAGRELFAKLLKVAERFLDVNLSFLGTVPEDPKLQKAVKARQAVIEAFPGSTSAAAFQRIAAQIESWPMPAVTGDLQFFIERLIDTDPSDEISAL